MKTRYPLKLCANGCGVPPAPPSLVICKACQDKITTFLQQEIDGKEKRMWRKWLDKLPGGKPVRVELRVIGREKSDA